jgi:hypothetical protein
MMIAITRSVKASRRPLSIVGLRLYKTAYALASRSRLFDLNEIALRQHFQLTGKSEFGRSA